MKKTITVNLNGRVFTIDEDAYRLLDNYLSNLRIYFRKEEGASEIFADFEARIEELLSERTRLGYQVITIEQVEEVIARVGKPDDFADKQDETEKEEKQTHFTESKDVRKKYYRNIDDKMFGGVCSGIAAYFGWDVLAVRIIFIILLFATSFWIVPFYLIAWIVFPGANTAEQKLRMRGKAITVENIGKTVASEAEPAVANERKGCLAGFIDLIVGLMKVFLVGLGCLVGLPLLFALFIIIIVLIAVVFGVGGGMLGAVPSFIIVSNPTLLTITSLLVIGIPIVALVYGLIAYFAKLSPLNRPVIWTFLIIWILSLALLFASGFRFNRNVWLKTYISDYQAIRGNDIFTQRHIDFDEAVSTVEHLSNYLCADFQIEQTENEFPSIEVSGDENLVEQVRYELINGKLILSAHNRISCHNNLKITLRTNDLKTVLMGSTGNFRINRAFASDILTVIVKGVGNFYADSLYVNSLTVRTEGVGLANISGKAGNVHLGTAGVGKIDAIELLSDTVYAKVEGVGSIHCNPVEYFEGSTYGVGSIIYKDDPKSKRIISAGIGKIKKR